MADVFISYKSERRAAAEHLAEILADYGYSVWWDYGLVSGQEFGAQIERELRAAKAVIVLWCSLSRESPWVKDEAALAVRLGTAVPTMIERIDLPLGFGQAQTVDLTAWDGGPQSHHLQLLLREVAAKVGRPPTANLEGLARTERAWRRFGAPSLMKFALIAPLERTAPPRTLPGGIGGATGPGLPPPVPSPPAPPPSPPPPPEPTAAPGSNRMPLVALAALGILGLGLLIGTTLDNSRQPERKEEAATEWPTATATPTEEAAAAVDPAAAPAAGPAAPDISGHWVETYENSSSDRCHQFQLITSTSSGVQRQTRMESSDSYNNSTPMTFDGTNWRSQDNDVWRVNGSTLERSNAAGQVCRFARTNQSTGVTAAAAASSTEAPKAAPAPAAVSRPNLTGHWEKFEDPSNLCFNFHKFDPVGSNLNWQGRTQLTDTWAAMGTVTWDDSSSRWASGNIGFSISSSGILTRTEGSGFCRFRRTSLSTGIAPAPAPAPATKQ